MRGQSLLPRGSGRPRNKPALALTAVLLAALFVMSCARGKVDLPGTNLDAAPAPDFRLTDQSGNAVALSDSRGKVVLLTFLHTSCPDFCPLMAVKLRQTVEAMGADGRRVALVAVSVDPERDDRRAAMEFTATHRLDGYDWHYLAGTEAELAPVWAAYGVGRLPRGAPAVSRIGAPVTDVLGHTEALYVIDPKGRELTLLRGDFDPDDLARRLRKLAK